MYLKKSITLSKTRLKRGLQCAKSLYLTLFRKELEPKPGPALQMQFDEGHEVGEAAQKYFGSGYLIDLKPWDFSGYVRETTAAMERGEELIFEASFASGNLFARTDILRKVRDKWDIIEVKKSTDVKPDHLDDITIQYLISEKAGLKTNRLFVMHINRECVHPNLEDFFLIRDVTEQVYALADSMKSKLNELWILARDSKEPKVEIGPHCEVPYDCVFRDHCWKKIPEISVFNIYKIGNKKWDYFKEGILEIADVKAEDFTGNIKRMVECTQENRRFVDKKGIKDDLKPFVFPLYFLDFETVMFAIPRYPGTRPYQQIPVQFSLHVWSDPTSPRTTHNEFLHVEDSDPGLSLLNALTNVIGDEGSIVSYNKRFESDCLKQLALRFPEFTVAVDGIITRLVDPLPIFQNQVYDPQFRGSFSIKTVAPALLGAEASYQDMAIGDGEMAQVVLRQLVTNKYSGDRKQAISDLLVYCKKDTWLMVELVRWLFKEIE